MLCAEYYSVTLKKSDKREFGSSTDGPAQKLEDSSLFWNLSLA